MLVGEIFKFSTTSQEIRVKDGNVREQAEDAARRVVPRFHPRASMGA